MTESTGCDDTSCSNLQVASELNQACYCRTLDNDQLQLALGQNQLDRDLLISHPQLFSNVATFISRQDAQAIAQTIQTIERVIALPAYQEAALHNEHPHARYNPGTAGVFMGYDFHLTEGRPQLIEINTNAGGGFLNQLLRQAQAACCPPMTEAAINGDIYADYLAMFLNEWQLQRGAKPLKRIAIVDNHPEQQFLFPEFKMAQRLFASTGIDTLITSPESLTYNDNQLWHHGKPIDLAYNRLTDFALAEPASDALNRAYQDDAVVVTPAPYHHALYADKRNLILLSDKTKLQALGCPAEDIATLVASIPTTLLVTNENAESLWQQRKHFFFKPAMGYGGKATYRGDKLTKGVWHQIINGDYVAQNSVTPSERKILIDGEASALKLDVRAYTYQGHVQLMTARLYQGQTTNFRTQGGGFSPVFLT